METFHFACCHQHADAGTLGHGQAYLLGYVGVVDADDGLDRGAGVAIDNVVLGEHVGGGDDHGPQLVQGQHDDPPLIASLEDEHHRVALADAQRLEIGGGLVALLLQLCEGGANLRTLVVGPEQGQLVGCFLGPLVHHVIGEVEVLGDDELEVLVVILH